MPTDDREVLEVLKVELGFLEKGGYGRSIRTPWLPTSIFQDSPTCLNSGDPSRGRACHECLLTALVPPERLSEKVPCHHIPLTPDGETIDFLERNETPDRMDETVKNWLRCMIRILEEVRADQAAPSRRDGQRLPRSSEGDPRSAAETFEDSGSDFSCTDV